MRSDGSGTREVLSELVGPLILGGTVVRLDKMDRGFRHVSPTGPPRQVLIVTQTPCAVRTRPNELL
jgi:hypothetical protein